MLKKEVKFGTDVSRELLSGIKKLHDAVVVTMGVGGRNVMFNREDGMVQVTKDGVTVAKSITHLANPTENFGARVVKHSAIRTGEIAGDGTTTSTLLSYHLINEALKLIEKGSNVVQVQKGIEKASKLVLEKLCEFKLDITQENSTSVLTKIATLSSNGDVEVANLIVKAIEEVGRNGIVSVTPSKYEDVRMEHVIGTRFSKGWLSENFINNGEKLSSELIKPIIVICDKEVSNPQSITPVLQFAYSSGRDVLFMAKSFSGGAMATIIQNATQGIVKMCAVELPDFREGSKEIVRDLCAITGATLISLDTGFDMVDFEPDWVGGAESISITKSTTTIVNGFGDMDDIKLRVDIIRKEIDLTDSAFGKNMLHNRLMNLIGGVCNIHIGGKTKIEAEERYDRAEDALKATYCALDEGILMGGGVALMITENMIDFNDEHIFVNKHQRMGANVVKNVLSKPFEQIMRNVGYEEREIYGLIHRVINTNNNWDVFDPLNDKIVDGYEAGIIDPYKVTRTALENAVSVCGTIITTECVIEEHHESNSNMNSITDLLAQLQQ